VPKELKGDVTIEAVFENVPFKVKVEKTTFTL
jgi:hypothetical protein